MAEESDAGTLDVFDLVSNPTRMAILRALADRQRESLHAAHLDYSEMRARTGVRDKGNFNYHLDRLVDRLVLKTDRGYRLSAHGHFIVGTILSGQYAPDRTWGPVNVADQCFTCDESLDLCYDDGRLQVQCERGHSYGLFPRPSVVENRPIEDVLAVLALEMARTVELQLAGSCLNCHGQTDGQIRQPDSLDWDYQYLGYCHRCGSPFGWAVGTCVLPHPSVNAFLYERGVDVRRTPFWELDFCEPGAETVVSDDPLRIRVDVEREGDRLSLTMDRQADVVAVDPPGE